MSFISHEQDQLLWFTSSLLKNVRHGFSTRKGGVSQGHLASLNLRGAVPSGDDPELVLENYRRFCAAIGTDVNAAVLSKQVHETTVRICTEADAGKGLWSERDYTADALVSDVKGLPLTVFSADCGIILLHDPVHQAIGAVHAGWRGCAAGIVEKAVQTMTAAYGTRPADLLAAIGPCIGQCCFETDDDVPAAMRAALGEDAESYLEQRPPKWHVDLAGLNRQWLLRAGLMPEQIETSGLCTGCHPELFWSHRKMGNARGAQVAMITL